MLTALIDTPTAAPDAAFAPAAEPGADGLPAEAEAARYALLRRLGPALRHDLVVHLQALAMMAEVLGARLERDPQDSSLPQQLGRMHLLARDAVAGALQVAGWLLPPEDDAIDLRDGLEESLGLVRSSLGFRGLQLQADLPEAGLAVSRDRLRHLLLGGLLHLSDLGGPAGTLRVQARADAAGARLRLSLEAQELGAGLAGIRGEPEGADDPGDDDASGRDEETAAVSTDTRITPDEEAGYRALRWADVQALAGETQATRHFTPPVIELRLPRAEARTPLQVAPR